VTENACEYDVLRNLSEPHRALISEMTRTGVWRAEIQPDIAGGRHLSDL
jgi:hypothetical protein